MVRLVFSKQAVEQMLARRISPEDVESIVGAPDGAVDQSRDKRVLYKRLPKRNDNSIAAVVVSLQGGNVLEVITVLHHFEVRR